ncbi:acetyltransferase [Colletotrichum graminicola]|uniref:Acetyltransferase n=1 Tax=Colletotrichum graminicola (strain M1.001 / M2 / FGSC 10212) TaxID=645133 RepID=E3Q210_COLGM|nr:acetyltransferase [Colletotrichum graminicola M1.001]EFQ25111.1 acetyltransferase [Colletotrichum graminicola M1.001]WDK15281.1 acetyltransferase [Colletotrichum graminicola]
MTIAAPKRLSFRPATPADVPVLLPLIRSAYRGDSSRRGWTTEADLVADKRIDEAGLLAKITEPESVVLLVTDAAASSPLLACCEVARSGTDPAVAYFGLFAVDPARQAGGVGRAVLAHAEAFARARLGARRMEMCVIWTRAELIAWYVRRGYARTGERRGFPYAELVDGPALRDDLWFEVLEKEL